MVCYFQCLIVEVEWEVCLGRLIEINKQFYLFVNLNGIFLVFVFWEWHRAIHVMDLEYYVFNMECLWFVCVYCLVFLCFLLCGDINMVDVLQLFINIWVIIQIDIVIVNW